jgi:hypothetical protein
MRYTIIRGKGTRTWFVFDNDTGQQSGGRFQSKRDAFKHATMQLIYQSLTKQFERGSVHDYKQRQANA